MEIQLNTCAGFYFDCFCFDTASKFQFVNIVKPQLSSNYIRLPVLNNICINQLIEIDVVTLLKDKSNNNGTRLTIA